MLWNVLKPIVFSPMHSLTGDHDGRDSALLPSPSPTIVLPRWGSGFHNPYLRSLISVFETLIRFVRIAHFSTHLPHVTLSCTLHTPSRSQCSHRGYLDKQHFEVIQFLCTNLYSIPASFTDGTRPSQPQWVYQQPWLMAHDLLCFGFFLW